MSIITSKTIGSFETVQDIFDATFAKFNPTEHKGENYIANMTLSGDGGGEWTVSMTDGDLKIEEGLTETAQMNFSMEANDFIRQQNGKANTMVLYMRGKIRAKGDFKVGMKLQKIWPRA